MNWIGNYNEPTTSCRKRWIHSRSKRRICKTDCALGRVVAVFTTTTAHRSPLPMLCSSSFSITRLLLHRVSITWPQASTTTTTTTTMMMMMMTPRLTWALIMYSSSSTRSSSTMTTRQPQSSRQPPPPYLAYRLLLLLPLLLILILLSRFLKVV